MTNPMTSVNLPNFAALERSAAIGADGASAGLPVNSKAFSFEIGAKPAPAPAEDAIAPVEPALQVPALPPRPSDLPMLPRKKRSPISSHRHDANPALALKVLADIHSAVEGWHQALRQTLQAIQAIYQEGPIIEGWLEMVAHEANPAADAAAILRHADPQELTGYVDRLCQSAAHSAPAAGSPTPPQYRLCSLDADGQMQCQLCPPDQLPVISLAVARHQKLRQHLNQKQYLEARLKRAVDALSQVRETLGIAPDA